MVTTLNRHLMSCFQKMVQIICLYVSSLIYSEKGPKKSLADTMELSGLHGNKMIPLVSLM